MSSVMVFDLSKSLFYVHPDAARIACRLYGESASGYDMYIEYEKAKLSVPLWKWLLDRVYEEMSLTTPPDIMFVTEELPDLIRQWAAYEAIVRAKRGAGFEFGPYWGAIKYSLVTDSFTIKGHGAREEEIVHAEHVTFDMLIEELRKIWARAEEGMGG